MRFYAYLNTFIYFLKVEISFQFKIDIKPLPFTIPKKQKEKFHVCIIEKSFNSDVLVANIVGMLLNCSIFGAMFRPLKPTRIKVKSTPENAGLEVKNSLIGRGVSMASLHCVQPERSGFFGTNNNTDYPTAAELLGSNPNIVK